MPEPLHNLEELSVNGSRLGALPPPLRRQEEFPQHGSPLSRQRLQEPATPEERTPDRGTPELSSAQKLKRDMDMIVHRDEQRVAKVAAEKATPVGKKGAQGQECEPSWQDHDWSRSQTSQSSGSIRFQHRQAYICGRAKPSSGPLPHRAIDPKYEQLPRHQVWS